MNEKMKKWKEVRLGEIATFRNGLNYNKDNFGSGIKVINVSDFKDNSFPEYSKIGELDKSVIRTDNDLLLENDILFVRSNGNRELVGRSLFIKNLLEPISFSAFTIRLRFTATNIEPLFFSHFFNSQTFRKKLSSQSIGTNINNLNQDILNNLHIPLPPLPTQQRIAAILSAGLPHKKWTVKLGCLFIL